MNLFDSLREPFRRIVGMAEEISRELGVEAWVVGGTVRDILIERHHGASPPPEPDLDIAVSGRADELARRLASALGAEVTLHPAFLTATVHVLNHPIDIATTRSETYAEPGALPRVDTGSIEQDLERRDFTVNAIAIALDGGAILDPLGGEPDVERRLIRTLHAASFRDDPTRLDRAARLAARLRFSIESSTFADARNATAEGVRKRTSPDRIWNEFTLIAAEDEVAGALAILGTMGALDTPWGIDGELPAEVETALRRVGRAKLPREMLEDVIAGLLTGYGGTSRVATLPITLRRRQSIRRIATEAAEIAQSLRRLSPTELMKHSIELPLGLYVAAAVLDDGFETLLEVERKVRSIELPFSGEDVSDQPGPHIAKALRDVRVALASGSIPRQDALEFARTAALRYLSRL